MASDNVLQYEPPRPKPKRRLPVGAWVMGHVAGSYAVAVVFGVITILFKPGDVLGTLLMMASTPVVLPIGVWFSIENRRLRPHTAVEWGLLSVGVLIYVVGFVWTLRRARRAVVPPHLRYPAGRCRECGYDLSQSPDPCPECGTFPYRDHETVTVEQAGTALEKMGEESPVVAAESVDGEAR